MSVIHTFFPTKNLLLLRIYTINDYLNETSQNKKMVSID